MVQDALARQAGASRTGDCPSRGAIGSEYLPFIDRLPHSLAGLGQSKAGEMLYVVAPVKVK